MNSFSYIGPGISECKFLAEPIIIRVNDVDEASAKKFSAKMAEAQNTGQPIIPVIIDSYGGHGYSLLSMISDIEHSTVPVATIVQGKAMSAGAILMTFGTKGYRYIDQHAHVMIHQAASASNYAKVAEVMSDAEELKRLNTQLYEMMAANCGKTKKYFIKEMLKRENADWYLTANQVIKLKMADKIGVPTLNREVSLNWTFGV